jgi:hypothetical protein
LIADDGATDGAVDAGALGGAADGAELADGDAAVPWQAANRIAVMASTAPVRIRVMRFCLLLRYPGRTLLRPIVSDRLSFRPTRA